MTPRSRTEAPYRLLILRYSSLLDAEGVGLRVANALANLDRQMCHCEKRLGRRRARRIYDQIAG